MSGRTSLGMSKTDQLTSKYLGEREGHFGILKIQYIKLIVFKVLVTGGLLAIGGLLVLNQEMNIGQFVAAEIIILLILTSVEKLIKGLDTIYDLLTSLEKLGQVVDKKLEKTEGENSLEGTGRLNVELDDVTYVIGNNKPIIKDVSLNIPAGRKILLKGVNGSGRTALLKLIAGINEISKGTIYANNLSIKGLKINEYRDRLGVFLPEEFPFEGTLLENITFGDKSIPDRDVYWAIEQVGLSKFVKQQPHGINSTIFPEGKFMSSLVGKRIILARAIVKRPDLLILKEPLELFEEEEAERLLKFFTDPSHSWSIVVASRNKYWEKHCDETVVLENGQISKQD